MWQIQWKKGKPIYQQVIDYIAELIHTGQLLPGEKLPAERKLAESFGVNRSTIIHALDELTAQGVLVRRQGSGTTVNEGKWGLFTKPTINWRQYLAQNAFDGPPPYITKIQEKLRRQKEDVIDAYTGDLPLELIPSFELPPVSWQAFLKEDREQDDFGYPPLRDAISQMLMNEYDFRLDQQEILMTSGAQQALFLIIQVLLQAGDAVAIEEPSFFYALPLFQGAGIRLYGVAMDEDGMRMDRLEDAILKHKVKMVMVNPTLQNPVTTTMSVQRRKALVALCHKYQIPIIEDDVFGQLLYQEQSDIIPLKKLDPANVVYIGSLSKILGATTKIGWVSAPPAVLKKLASARQEMDFVMSIFPQVLATYALREADFTGKINGLKLELKQRSDAFIDLLEKELPHVFQYQRPSGGYYLWLESEANIAFHAYDDLLQADLLTLPGKLMGARNFGLRINTGRLNQVNREKFIARFAQVVKKWDWSRPSER